MAIKPAFVAKLKTGLEQRKDKVALTPIPGQKALFWVRYKNKQVGISYYDIATGRYSFTPQYDTLDNMARYVVQTNKGIQEARGEVDPVLKSRLLPAFQDTRTKKIITGKRGETHEDILNDRILDDDVNYKHHMPGFYDPLSKKFFHHNKWEVWGLDATDLMTSSQRRLKYGDFAEATSFIKALLPKRHPTIRTKIEVWRKQREVTGRPVRKLKPLEKKMRALHKPQKSAFQVLWHKYTHHPKHDWSTKPPKLHKARHNKPDFISVRPNLKAEPSKR